jgi:hypothetical protein
MKPEQNKDPILNQAEDQTSNQFDEKANDAERLASEKRESLKKELVELEKQQKENSIKKKIGSINKAKQPKQIDPKDAEREDKELADRITLLRKEQESRLLRNQEYAETIDLYIQNTKEKIARDQISKREKSLTKEEQKTLEFKIQRRKDHLKQLEEQKLATVQFKEDYTKKVEQQIKDLRMEKDKEFRDNEARNARRDSYSSGYGFDKSISENISESPRSKLLGFKFKLAKLKILSAASFTTSGRKKKVADIESVVSDIDSFVVDVAPRRFVVGKNSLLQSAAETRMDAFELAKAVSSDDHAGASFRKLGDAFTGLFLDKEYSKLSDEDILDKVYTKTGRYVNKNSQEFINHMDEQEQSSKEKEDQIANVRKELEELGETKDESTTEEKASDVAEKISKILPMDEVADHFAKFGLQGVPTSGELNSDVAKAVDDNTDAAEKLSAAVNKLQGTVGEIKDYVVDNQDTSIDPIVNSTKSQKVIMETKESNEKKKDNNTGFSFMKYVGAELLQVLGKTLVPMLVGGFTKYLIGPLMRLVTGPVGAIAGSFAVGWGIGTAIRKIMPQSWLDTIGEAIYYLVNPGEMIDKLSDGFVEKVSGLMDEYIPESVTDTIESVSSFVGGGIDNAKDFIKQKLFDDENVTAAQRVLDIDEEIAKLEKEKESFRFERSKEKHQAKIDKLNKERIEILSKSGNAEVNKRNAITYTQDTEQKTMEATARYDRAIAQSTVRKQSQMQPNIVINNRTQQERGGSPIDLYPTMAIE